MSQPELELEPQPLPLPIALDYPTTQELALSYLQKYPAAASPTDIRHWESLAALVPASKTNQNQGNE
jgi:hypothetical protein